ncbi:Receptor-like protein 12 [Morella rubra]|uniref:Receptor-like protein 12 n=1 Tax=Morella rubra TaxID=262757 RepID=A0A6A1WGB8_9ROSI|nr:Receptor-like protein 12 [Morella rubra]
MDDGGSVQPDILQVGIGQVGEKLVNFRIAVIVSIKGHVVDLVNVLTVFTSIDFSCNNFDGPLPEELGGLKLLHLLNLSHNVFTSKIPPSLGKLTCLESLDLSTNKLTGKIPLELADGLIFLSVLNLSFNQLTGHVLLAKQFATFSETSYEGNKGLRGFPLKNKCRDEESPSPSPTFKRIDHSKSRVVANWNYISVELGYIFGFGIVIGPLVFWKKWRIWYYRHIDNICFQIFPRCYLKKEYHRRGVQRSRE